MNFISQFFLTNKNNPCFIDKNGAHSSDEIFLSIKKFASYLKFLNIQKGNFIIIKLPDTAFLPIAIFGSMWIGAIPVLVGSGKCGVEHNFNTLNQAKKKFENSLIIANEIDYSNFKPIETQLDFEQDLECIVFHTSGRTGAPKFISHTPKTLLNVGEYMGDLLLDTNDRSLFCAEKITHAYGFALSICVALKNDITAILLDASPSKLNLCHYINTYKPSIFAGTPRHFEFIKDEEFTGVRLAVNAGFAPINQLKGAAFLNGEGSTETLGFYKANGIPLKYDNIIAT